MACITESRLDHLSKIIASSVSRRDAFRYAGVTALAMALSTVGLRKAEAGKNCAKDCVACGGQAECNRGNCIDCSCIPKVRDGAIVSKCFCHEFVNCDDLVECADSKDCKKAGLKGYRCAVSCCGPSPIGGFCHPKCGKGPVCADGAAPVTIGGGRTSRG